MSTLLKCANKIPREERLVSNGPPGPGHAGLATERAWHCPWHCHPAGPLSQPWGHPALPWVGSDLWPSWGCPHGPQCGWRGAGLCQLPAAGWVLPTHTPVAPHHPQVPQRHPEPQNPLVQGERTHLPAAGGLGTVRASSSTCPSIIVPPQALLQHRAATCPNSVSTGEGIWDLGVDIWGCTFIYSS